MKNTSYIATIGDVKSRTSSTVSGNASMGCTNASTLTYGAYPAEYSTNNGKYCVQWQDVLICTGKSTANCTANITASPAADGLQITVTGTPSSASYNMSSIKAETSTGTTTIATGTSSISWNASIAQNHYDFKITASAIVANNKIFYTSTDGTIVNPSTGASWGGLALQSNTYSDNQGIMVFNGDVTTVGANSFNGCSTLKTITLPSTVTAIGASAFKGTGMTGFTVPSGVTVINANTFQNCTSLASCTLHNNITSLGNYAFDGCSALANPTTLPTQLTTIGSYCFRNCTSLTAMTIPVSVTTVGAYAFYDCSGFKNFTFGPTITSFQSTSFEFEHRGLGYFQLGACTFRGTIAQLRTMFGGTTSIQALHLPSSYGIICTNGLFTDYGQVILYRTSSQAALAPYSTTVFGNNQYGTCTLQSNTYYGDSNVGVMKFNYVVDYIGNNAFLNKTGYTMMALNWAVKSLGNYDFSGCTGLTAITFGYDIENNTGYQFTSIGDECFKNCSSLANFNFYGYMSQWSSGITFGTSWSSGLSATNATCLDGDYPLTGADRITYTASSQITFNTTAFQDANGITATVSSHTFSGTKGVIIFDRDIAVVGNSAFNANTYSTCTNITNMVLPLTITNIGNYAFFNCTSLQSVNLKSLVNLQTIGNYAFGSCSALFNTSLTTTYAGIANSVTSIGSYAFVDCTGMIAFTIPSSGDLTTINECAFENCSSLGNVTLPNGLTSLGQYAFWGCTTMTSMTIPSGITALQPAVLYGCTSLNYLMLPSTMTSFGNSCLYNTTSLKYINFSGTTDQFNSITKTSGWNTNSAIVMAFCSNDWFLIDDTKIIYRTSDSTALAPTDTTAFSHTYNSNTYDTDTTRNIGIMSFSGNLTSIGSSAFNGKTGYTKMIIAKTITSLGSSAFSGCTGLTTLPIQSYHALSTIGDNCFASCTGLTTLTIPDNITTIRNQAFMSCTGATAITIGTGLSTVTNNPFYACYNVISITVASGNSTFDSRNSCNAIIRKSDTTLITGCRQTIIPSTVTAIGPYAFAYMGSSFTSITIPASVTSIQSAAFYGCTGMTAITLPNTVTTLGDNVFNGCSSLSQVTLSSGLTSIGTNTFTNTNVVGYIYNGTKSAFDDITKGSSWNGTNGKLVMCTDKWKLLYNNIIAYQSSTDATVVPYSTTVFGVTYNSNTYYTTYSSTTYHFGLISFSGNVTQCGSSAFYNKTAYTKMYLPDTVTTIGENAFYGCSGLAVIDYSAVTGTIGQSAFRGTTALTSISIPSGVTAISSYAFYQSGITSLTLPNTVTSMDTYACYGCTELISATLGTGITALQTYVFKSCTALASLTMNGVVTTFNSQACYDCTSLSAITYAGTKSQYIQSTRASDWHTNVPTTTITCSDGSTPIDPVYYCMHYMTSNSHTATPASGAFNTNIIDNTYSGTIGTWQLESALTTINAGAFNVTGCQYLTSITLPSSITLLYGTALQGPGLSSNDASICYDGTYANYQDIRYEYDYNYNVNPYVYCSDRISYVMPNAVKYVSSTNAAVAPSSSPFLDAYNVTLAIQLNNYNTTLGYGVYHTSDSIKGIAHNSFENITTITQMYIADTVTSIGDEAFKGMTGLTSIRLPYNLTVIGAGMLYGCTSLTDILYPGTVSMFNSITLGTDWNAGINTMYVHCSDGDIFFGTEIQYTTSNSETITGYISQPFNQAWQSNSYSGTGSMKFINAPTMVNAYAFNGRTSLTSMTLNSQITTISQYAFNNTRLTSMTLPSSLTTIGSNAFTLCPDLHDITIPRYVTSISSGFVTKGYMTSISVNANNTTFDSRDDCNAIIRTSTDTLICGCPTTTIPSTVTIIDTAAFAGCSSTGFTAIDIPDNITTINDNAFEGTSLVNVSIGANLSSLTNNAFMNCVNLAYITVDGDNATYDSRNDCNAIIETGTNTLITGCINTVIPDDIETIGEYAFFGTGITSMSIPDSVTLIGDNAFAGCSSLASVIFYGTEPPTVGETIFGGCENFVIYVPAGCVESYKDALSDYEDFIQEMPTLQQMCYCTNDNNPANPTNPGAFGDGVTIASNVYDSTLKSCVITFNGTATTIGTNAFKGCNTITSIDIPSTVTSIGDSAFESTGLTSITLSDNVTSIGSCAFKECYSLSSATLTDSISVINSSAFENTTLTSITIPSNKSLTSIPTGCFAYTSLTSIDLPVNITNIGSNAYIGCGYVENVSLSSALTTISDNAFNNVGCKVSDGFKLTIPSSVTSIGKNAFEQSGVNIVYMEESVGTSLTVQDCIFKGCQMLKQITIPSTLDTANSSLDEFCYDCTSLVNINFNDNKSELDIAVDMFYGCTSLQEIILPDNVISIGEGAFAGCSSLMSVIIPEYVTSIGDGAFSQCTALTNIVVLGDPDNITVGTDAFYNLPSYSTMYGAVKTVWTGIANIGTAVEYIGTAKYKTNTATTITFGGKSVFGYDESELSHRAYGSDNMYYIQHYNYAKCALLDIEENLFNANNNQLINMYLPNNGSITIIGATSFQDAASLSNIILPNTIRSIDDLAFYKDESLQYIILDNSLTSIGTDVFNGCSSLSDIYYKGTMTQWQSIKFGKTWYGAAVATCVHCIDGDVDIEKE